MTRAFVSATTAASTLMKPVTVLESDGCCAAAGTASATAMSKRPRKSRMARHLTPAARRAGAGYRTPGDGRVLRVAVD